MAGGWSSLPSDLVGRIADLFLATNDVDCYTDFRAVCHDWRCTTDDPRNTSDPRFRPRQWIVMDAEDYGDARLLLNTATGRFLRRDMMMANLLRSHHRVVAVAAGGFLVLADKTSPQAAGVRVLNPLTGHSIRFRAPLPTNVFLENAAAVLGPSPTLVLCDGSGKLYRADPASESFAMYKVMKNSPARQFIANGVYDLRMRSLAFPGHDRCHMITRWPFVVESAGETLAIFMRQQCVEVFSFKIATAADGNNELIGPVKSIGGRAIFVGDSRCLCVEADMFPTVDPDCIYYMESVGSDDYVYVYDMKKMEAKMVIRLPVVSDHNRPFSIIQLLSSYTDVGKKISVLNV